VNIHWIAQQHRKSTIPRLLSSKSRERSSKRREQTTQRLSQWLTNL